MVVADTLDSEVVLPELKAFVAKSLAKCMKAVDNVTVLVDKIGTRKELIPPYLTYLIYTVATVVVSVSFSSKEEEAQKARKALPAYMKFLVVKYFLAIVIILLLTKTLFNNDIRQQEITGLWRISYIL